MIYSSVYIRLSESRLVVNYHYVALEGLFEDNEKNQDRPHAVISGSKAGSRGEGDKFEVVENI